MQYLTTVVGIDPLLATLMRVVFAGLIYLAYLFIRYRKTLREMFSSWRSAAFLLLFAFALYANQLSYAETVYATNAGTATVLQMLGCVFVLAFVCLYSRRLPIGREIAGILVALAATVMIATQGDLRALVLPLGGLIWGLVSAVTSAAYILIPRQTGLMDRFGAIPTVGMGMTLSILFAIPAYAIQGGSGAAFVEVMCAVSPFEWAVFIVGLVILGTIVGFVAFLYGTSIVGPVRGALLGAIEPVSATVLSAIFLGTAFTGFDIAGMLLMCLMVFLISGKERKPLERDGDAGA